MPKFQLGDGAKAITNAGETVFVGHSFVRLMCWAHVHSNLLKHLKSVNTINKKIAEDILKDIDNLQWSALNEATFKAAFKLLEEKYLGKHDDVLNEVIKNFFVYMHNVWIDSPEFRWFEGSHPWEISNNQCVE